MICEGVFKHWGGRETLDCSSRVEVLVGAGGRFKDRFRKLGACSWDSPEPLGGLRSKKFGWGGCTPQRGGH